MVFVTVLQKYATHLKLDFISRQYLFYSFGQMIYLQFRHVMFHVMNEAFPRLYVVSLHTLTESDWLIYVPFY